jgi:protocatechuate 3,4-dioxygenase beta subunit
MTFLCFVTALNRWSHSVGLLLMFVVCALLPGTARGQASAAIKGTVYDGSGGIVPDAAVVLHNTATNLDRTTSSNEAGAYVIPDIQPGESPLPSIKPRRSTSHCQQDLSPTASR